MKILSPTRLRFPFHLRREAVILIVLSLSAVVLFVTVSALAQLFSSQQASLSDRWSSRGAADLKAGKYADAAQDFHSALRYSRDDYDQQLGLAEALIGLKRTDEASSYLNALWEEQPENGVVNRELARIAAGKKDQQRALRYYHNAIYASWPVDADKERRATRWELIKYLLSLHANAQAQSELISLAADVGDDPTQQIALGNFFLKVQDDAHAMGAFKRRLQVNPHNPEALAGAGAAAFDMGEYEQAQRYLRHATEDAPEDRDAAVRLQSTEQVLKLDPFRPNLSSAERARAAMAAFDTAGDRVKGCPAVGSLESAWTQMKPNVTAMKLQRDADAVSRVMDVVFQIEKDASAKCGTGSPADAALVLIARQREGS